MPSAINVEDVPTVEMHDMYFPMRQLISDGRGLALYYGMSETDLRALEDVIWADFNGDSETRLAIALRFRALVQAFSQRRLKELFLKHGFKGIALAINVAAHQRLNTRFGFNVQKLVSALDRATPKPTKQLAQRELEAA